MMRNDALCFCKASHQLMYPVVYRRILSVFIVLLETNLDTSSLWLC